MKIQKKLSFNKTSFIRQGFNYQDGYGLYLIGEWLLSPTKYKWIQFENNSEEGVTEGSYLDDIVLENYKGKYHLYQIKFKYDADFKWQWNNFLQANSSNKSSLLQKWVSSFFKNDFQKIESAAFVTNSAPSVEIQLVLTNNRIQLSKIRESNILLYNHLLTFFDNKERAEIFFEKFQFVFFENELDQKIKNIYYERLFSTKGGFDNLVLRIKEECRQKFTSRITIEKILSWLECYNPKPLNQKFEIPTDFILYDKNAHLSLLKELRNLNGGVKLFLGKPGMGKSTYLSYLFKKLKQHEIPVFKHHYFISSDDFDYVERLYADRSIEALKAQLIHFLKKNGSTELQNFKNKSIKEIYKDVLKITQPKDIPIIVIIDGLDHVSRNIDENELESFLQQVSIVSPGIWLIYGTQENAKDLLPPLIKGSLKENSIIELKGFSKHGVKEIVTKNNLHLTIPNEKFGLNEFINKLFNITEGNPLHLRYTLFFLKNKHRDKHISEYSLRKVLPYNGNIQEYYTSIWNNLSFQSKLVLCILNSVDFNFSKAQLFELLNLNFLNAGQITKSYNSVSHLLEKDKKHLVVYHNSFKVFIHSQPEFDNEVLNIRIKIKEWLSKSHYNHLKWKEIRKLEYYSGNSAPIFEIDREWLIDSISKCFDKNDVVSQLEICAEASYKEHKFDKTLESNLLSGYFQDSVESYSESYSNIISESIFLNFDNKQDYNIKNLSPSNIYNLLLISCEHKDINNIAEEYFEELNDRLVDLQFKKDHEVNEDFPTIVRYILKVLSHLNYPFFLRTYKFIISQRSNNWSQLLFSIYAESLIQQRKYEYLRILCQKKLNAKEKFSLANTIAKNILKEKSYSLDFLIDILDSLKIKNKSKIHLLLELLLMRQIKLSRLIDTNSIELSVPDYDSANKKFRANQYFEIFIDALLYIFSNEKRKIEIFKEQFPKSWIFDLLKMLIEYASYVSNCLKCKSKIEINYLFELIKNIEFQSFNDDREKYQLQQSFTLSLSYILELIQLLNSYQGIKTSITIKEVKQIMRSKHFTKDNLLDYILEYGEPILTNTAFSELLNKKLNQLNTEVYYLTERTEDYLKLCGICRIHNIRSKQREFLREAINNFLAYGHHKDLFIDRILSCFQSYWEFTKYDCSKWLIQISSIVDNVHDFTDGDETSQFRETYGRVMSIINKKMFYKYFYYRTQQEKFYLSENLFKYVLDFLNFSDKIDFAIASTSVIESQYEHLKTIALKNEDAKKCLLEIDSHFGETYHKKRKYSSYTEKNELKEDEKISDLNFLESKLESYNSNWDKIKFLKEWLDFYFLNHKCLKIQDTEILIRTIKKIGIEDVNFEILDRLFDSVLVVDRDLAFKFLVQAQINEGWGSYWRNFDYEDYRWEKLKTFFPYRYLEYLEQSCCDISKSRIKKNYFFPMVGGVRFLLFFGETQKAKDIIDKMILFLCGLSANLFLPDIKWYELDYTDTLDILIQRLSCPFPMVKERTAFKLATLLGDEDLCETVYSRIFKWIENQKLESITIYGLIPILKSIEDKKLLAIVNVSKLSQAIKANSFIIDLIFKRISVALNDSNYKLPHYPVVQINTEQIVNELFDKYVSMFLPRIYNENSKSITHLTGLNLYNLWSCNFQQLFNSLNIQNYARSVESYYGSHYEGIIVGWSTYFSEIFRSSYLRVLQHIFNIGLLDEIYFRDYCLETFPIDFSFWKISPQRCPDFWPKFNMTNKSRTNRDSNDDNERIKKVEVIFDENSLSVNDSFIVLAIDGCIKPFINSFETEDHLSQVSIVGFGYKIVGNNIPNERTIAQKIFYKTSNILLSTYATNPLNYLGSQNQFVAIEEKPFIKLDDLLIFPLVSRVRPLATSIWQWYRGMRATFDLYFNLTTDTKIIINENSFTYQIGKNTVAESIDWTQGFKERLRKDEIYPGGQYIRIKKDFLENYLNSQNIRLAYIKKVKHFIEKDIHKEIVESTVFYDSINFSKIIL